MNKKTVLYLKIEAIDIGICISVLIILGYLGRLSAPIMRGIITFMLLSILAFVYYLVEPLYSKIKKEFKESSDKQRDEMKGAYSGFEYKE
jgi:hypothetical protein